MHNLVLMVSTCGTSLLTNVVKNAPDNELRLQIIRLANKKKLDEIPEEWRGKLVEHIQQRREILLAADLETAKKLSAELNSLISYFAGCINRPRDEYVLICTDTWLGEQAALILCEWLEAHKLMAQVKRIQDLQTSELTEFRLAMSDIVKWCAETLPGYRESRYHIVFNLTGGFKSIQGFMQTLGMFYADESIYTFESGNHLLSLPRLPVCLDVGHTLHKGLQAFRRAWLGLAVTEQNIKDLPETLFLVIDGQAVLSPWGQIVWEQGRKNIFAEKILEPVSPRLRLGDKFSETTKGLPSDRIIQINEKLDDLARFLENDVNPSSLNFKEVRHEKQKIAPSTHEAYAWSDCGAKRLFGHYENDVFVLDRLGDHL